MRTTSVAAPAKLNLHLEITGLDGSGYHTLETVFQTLDWADTVHVALSDQPGIRLSCAAPGVPEDERNLAHQAASAYHAARSWPNGLDLRIDKVLPAGGGLGGGSSNAAAVLRALTQLDPEPLSPAVLATIALQLGADVPFFLLGGCAHATGRGEQLTPLEDPQAEPVTVLVPKLHCSTPAVFAALSDEERGPRPARGAVAWAEALDDIPSCLFNRLQAAAARAYPELETVFAACRATGAPWLLSGSGACCFALGHHPAPDGLCAVHTHFRSRADLDRV
ncbi:MAG: 4-(cytidine 5'-diphospho)-2-C-methyl-D-erythritol kinase [Planctomycetota bacterium]|jgi:4-diphosphocytidyl-2-C-methyl-D-erythritol kinase|nr:4-(cytidine 5'-diphospho)-2-C-methyl-D-erythritol kinase [Planctomycetota bacterium]